MTVYAETSAVLAWLLDQPGAAEVEGVLGAEDDVISSDLTLVECDRALHRLQAAGRPGSANVEFDADSPRGGGRGVGRRADRREGRRTRQGAVLG